MSAYPRYTRAQIRHLSSLDPRDPNYLGPEDFDEDDEENQETMEEDDPSDHYDDDYTPLDNPADDYIMTERELRGEL